MCFVRRNSRQQEVKPLPALASSDMLRDRLGKSILSPNTWKHIFHTEIMLIIHLEKKKAK